MQSRTHLLLIPSSALLDLLTVGGCGLGSAGMAAAIDNDSTGGERVTTDLEVVSPIDGQSGRVLCRLLVQVDPREEIVLESAEYSLARSDHDFAPATAARGFPTEIEVGDSKTGSELTTRSSQFLGFVWNSHADLDRLRANGQLSQPVSGRATLRFRVRNTTTGEQLTATTSEFLLNHGLFSTVAGGGVGDGNRPQQASMLQPSSLALTSNGDLIVADSGNHRLRRLRMVGGDAVVVETFAGNGFQGIESGLLSATGTSMGSPFAVATLPGFVLDLERDESGATKLRTTLVERGLIATALQDYATMSGLATRAENFVYVVRRSPQMLHAYSQNELGLGEVRSFDISSTFSTPGAIAAAPDVGIEELFIADTTSLSGTNAEVRRVSLEQELDDTWNALSEDFAGGGIVIPSDEAIAGRDKDNPLLATELRISAVDALAVNSTHVFFADSSSGLVGVVERSSKRLVNVIDGLTAPRGLAVDVNGSLYVAESGATAEDGPDPGHRILRVDMAVALHEPEPVIVACGEATREIANGLEGIDGNVGDVDADQDPG